MNLWVDVGNSRCKWARQNQGSSLAEQQGVNYTPETLSKLLDAHWHRWGGAPQSVWVSNVAGAAVERTLRQWIAQHWGCEVQFAYTQKQACGVTNGYENPGQLGVDRWLALLAAHQLSPAAPCLVVDCGTAVTLDLLNERGQHQGGWILPGLHTMRLALQKNAHALQQNAATWQEPGQKPDYCAAPPRLKGAFLPARDTQNGLIFGTLYAVICLITQVWDTVSMHGKFPLNVFLTGGAAPEVYPHLTLLCRHEPNLVLQGLVCWSAQRGGKA